MNDCSDVEEPRVPSTRSQSRALRAGRRPTGADPGEASAPVRARAAAASPPQAADLCEVTCVNPTQVERARRALPDEATIRTLADTLKALGDPTRLQIVMALAAEGVGELCVCDLAALVDVSESAVSHSLRTLRHLRLVRYRKAGKIAYYTLDDAHVARVVTEGLRHVEEAHQHLPDPQAVA